MDDCMPTMLKDLLIAVYMIHHVDIGYSRFIIMYYMNVDTPTCVLTGL